MNTPRTDAATRMAFSGEYMVPIEDAQKLERELAEVKNDLDFRRDLYKLQEMQLAAVTKQRDELADALRGYMRFCGVDTTGEIPAKAYPSPLAKKGIEALQSLKQDAPAGEGGQP